MIRERKHFTFLSMYSFYHSCITNSLTVTTSMLKENKRKKFSRQTNLKHDAKGGEQEPNIFVS